MSPLGVSLVVAASATILVSLIAIPLAHRLCRAHSWLWTAFDTALILPLVLPPTVVGYVLVVLFGAQGWIGTWLREAFDYSIMFRVEGAILATAIVSFPLLYLPAKAAFRAVEPEMEDAAELAGARRWQVFWHVSLPTARAGILNGQALAFTRALGEFGASVMVFGWQPGRTTAPIAIYSAYERGRMSEAAWLVVALIVISFALLALLQRSSTSVKG